MEMTTGILIGIFIGLLVGGGSAYLFMNNKISKLQNEKSLLNMKQQQTDFYFQNLKENMEATFKNISNKILQEQRQGLQQEQTANLGHLLNPFKNDLTEFKNLIEKTNTQNAEDKGQLKQELLHLKTANNLLNENADNLIKALRGNNKIMGDWGEHQLKNILDMSGFLEGRDYQMQYNVKDENAANQRPDCVIIMPEGKKMIIDAKVSLANFMDYVKQEDEKLAKQHLQLHIESIKRHIKELAKKEYQKNIDGTSLDFVFMFIPNESAYLEALKSDNSVYDFAYKNNIAITTPSSIIPILRTIKNLWNIEKQNQNVKEISKTAGILYDKLYGFVENMVKIDKGISSAKTAYNNAFMQLSTGKGNAISIAERIKNMGAITTKQLPNEFTKKANLYDSGLLKLNEGIDNKNE